MAAVSLRGAACATLRRGKDTPIVTAIQQRVRSRIVKRRRPWKPREGGRENGATFRCVKPPSVTCRLLVRDPAAPRCPHDRRGHHELWLVQACEKTTRHGRRFY